MTVGFQCPHPFGHDDAAKKCADNVNLHYQSIGWDAVGKWCAVALNDGSSDHVLYDTRKEAVLHQHHNEQWFVFVKIIPEVMGYCEAQTFLDFHRKAYDAGFRLVDPEHPHGGRVMISPRGRAQETVRRQISMLDIARRNRRI